MPQRGVMGFLKSYLVCIGLLFYSYYLVFISCRVDKRHAVFYLYIWKMAQTSGGSVGTSVYIEGMVGRVRNAYCAPARMLSPVSNHDESHM